MSEQPVIAAEPSPAATVGSKLRYEYLSRRDAIEWQRRTPVDPANPLTDFRLRDHERCGMDQLVGVVAVLDGRIVGRNFFFHCPIEVRGHPVECLVSNDLFVAPEYRPRGIGVYIKMHVLKLGYPQISSGVSQAMQRVQDAWSAYSKIDSTPAYAIPVSRLGALRVARLCAQTPAGGERGGTLFHLVRQVRASQRLAHGADDGARRLPPRSALAALDGVLDSARFPVQIPWNRALLLDALAGQARKPLAAVYAASDACPHLLTGYLRHRSGRALLQRSTTFRELHVNEIFPPVRDAAVARSLLGHAVREARTVGADLVQFYASTAELRGACEAAGLRSFIGKSVYIAPNTRSAEASTLLRAPENWWFRALNEDQFEEVATSTAGALPDFAFLRDAT
jgi:GNAT superfamily N-acetyltransferase